MPKHQWVGVDPTNKKPYKVVLEHEGSADTEEGVETMREGEAPDKGSDAYAPKTRCVARSPCL
jgi:hypothetical protein